jgi:hypothetical protein
MDPKKAVKPITSRPRRTKSIKNAILLTPYLLILTYRIVFEKLDKIGKRKDNDREKDDGFISLLGYNQQG